MLEQQQAQLVTGLQELYRRTQSGKGWEGAPLKESAHGTPLTHEILDRLGALKSGRNASTPEPFEEDLNALQQRLLANGAGFMQRSPSDSGSDTGLSPTSVHNSRKPTFQDPFSLSRLPPTPPTHSPFPQNTSPTFSPKDGGLSYPHSLQQGVHTNLLQAQSWASSGMALEDDMELVNSYNTPFTGMPSHFDNSQMPVGTIAPCLSMRDWNRDVDFQRYFSSTMM
jgi:hypothetical protein